MSDKLGSLLKSVKPMDFQGFAQLLSEIERLGPAALKQKELLNPPKISFRWGVTGPPGAGKSTLIGQMIKDLRAQGLSVGVVAVDPSSPFTQGAILGDRIRYSEHFNDEGVFIRSLGSRGSLGGLSAAAYLMLRAYDWMGFDITLIETVGVGQTELEIMHVADSVSVVLVPESGDSIQAMKAGLLEIADLFVVNKSDRPGAEALVKELEASVQLGHRSGENVEVLSTTANSGAGVKELCQRVTAKSKSPDLQKHRSHPERLQWEARALLRAQWEAQIEDRLESLKTPEDLLALLS